MPNQSIPFDVTTQVAFCCENFTGGGMTPVLGANSYLQVPIAGIYAITATVPFINPAGFVKAGTSLDVLWHSEDVSPIDFAAGGVGVPTAMPWDFQVNASNEFTWTAAFSTRLTVNFFQPVGGYLSAELQLSNNLGVPSADALMVEIWENGFGPYPSLYPTAIIDFSAASTGLVTCHLETMLHGPSAGNYFEVVVTPLVSSGAAITPLPNLTPPTPSASPGNWFLGKVFDPPRVDFWIERHDGSDTFLAEVVRNAQFTYAGSASMATVAYPLDIGDKLKVFCLHKHFAGLDIEVEAHLEAVKVAPFQSFNPCIDDDGGGPGGG